jgi:hypothetical protein
MADVSAPTPIFSRGSAVLDYWLVHAEGLTIQPLGARVEEVVVAPPVGRAESLIVRSRVTRRRRAIPAESIAAVEPSAGQLLLDSREATAPRLHAPRLSPERIAAARTTAERGGRLAQRYGAGGLRWAHAGTVAGIAWLRPRAVRVSVTTVRHSRLAGARTASGIAWLAPRVAAGARTTAATAARFALAATVILARAAARTARELERATASAAERGRASFEERRARRESGPDDGDGSGSARHR